MYNHISIWIYFSLYSIMKYNFFFTICILTRYLTIRSYILIYYFAWCIFIFLIWLIEFILIIIKFWFWYYYINILNCKWNIFCLYFNQIIFLCFLLILYYLLLHWFFHYIFICFIIFRFLIIIIIFFFLFFWRLMMSYWLFFRLWQFFENINWTLTSFWCFLFGWERLRSWFLKLLRFTLLNRSSLRRSFLFQYT